MLVCTMEKLNFVFYFLFGISIAFCISDLDDIQNTCKQRCHSNVIESLGGNLFCNDDCWVVQCQYGCTKLSAALSSNCQKACVSNISQQYTKEAEARMQKQNCIRGCSLALDIYANEIKVHLEPLLKPDLIRESKNYSSVMLQWNGKILPDVTYMMQIRILDIHQMSSDWQIHNDSQFLANGKIAISNLHPYVTYKFRVLAVITPLPQHVAESPATVPITTLPHGVPANAPTITSISAPSPSVISISWNPPQFANGQLVGYRINVNPQNHPTLKPTTKDLLGGATSWTVGQLQPSQRYMITVSAWNAAGEGPADSRAIITPNPVSIHETPYLILGSANKVLKQNLMDLIHSVPDTIHDENNRNIMVNGIAIHIRRQVILVSDSSGKVQLISVTGDYREDNLYPSLLKPTAISIDWLNDWAYLASNNRIFRCPLNRDACIMVLEGLQSTPTDIKVDPVNGFLYFSQYGDDKGLYRVDLGDIGKNGPTFPSQLVSIDDLSSFVIDFENVRLYYPNSTDNTMMSVFVDGTDSRDIRQKVLQPDFYNILSIVSYKGLFYWTNGTKVLSEEFDPGFKKYRHNELLFFDNYYRGFNLYHTSAQPTPVPHVPPKKLQAMFTSQSVRVKWQAPPLLQYQGKGAWQNWTYELQLSESDKSQTASQFFNSSVLVLTIEELLPDTKYSLRIRAFSEAGYGPWSQYFIGRTIKKDKISVRVLMATSGQIIESDISQNIERTVVNFVSKATDISWHKDKLLWTSSSGILSVYDRSTGWRYNIQHVNYAACVAYDWLGKKIFWSEPQQGVIKRTDINGLSNEFISQAAARDIVIDSIAGRIYWATMNSIESSFLNGEDHIEIFSVPYFSGKHIISVTLNFDMKKVLWYVKSFENQDLFMADLITGEGTNVGDVISTVTPAGSFRSISRWSGLQYYSHRLFWMDQTSALVVGNMECNYTSVISPSNISVTAFAVMHPSMHSYPAGLNENNLQVIPNPMKPSSVKISGAWSSFNLTWKQATEVNHGKVFYKVYIQIAQQSTHIVTSKTWHSVEGLSPYTLMRVSIQPYTYWGYADPTRVSVRSPMSVPTQPLTPRVYITQRKNGTTSLLMLAADFRWSTPIIISGVLSHHIVYHWIEGQQNSTQHAQTSGIARHFILNNLIANQTYYFQVAACTDVGCGPKSQVVSAVTNALNPVPRLLIATKSSLRISEMDGHLKSHVLLSSISPSGLAFLAQDARTFWIEESNALYVSQSNKHVSLQDLNGTGKDLSMDWISRTVYVVEEESRTKNKIMGYHIDQDTYEEILLRERPVGSIVTDPYTSSLFWTENDSKGQGHIFYGSTNGNDITDLIGGQISDGNRKKHADPQCNCARHVNISPVIAVDYSSKGDTNIVFSDEDSYSIMTSDKTGCRCKIVFSATPGNSQGLPPHLMTVDHLRVYWYNKSEQKLYSVNKHTGADLLTQAIPDIQDIVAYGAHLQPLPDSACLDPGPYSNSVASERITNVSITLTLDEMKRLPHCAGISLPHDKYTVYYTKQPRSRVVGEHVDCSTETTKCKTLETYKREITIKNLEPYTDYIVQVAVSNYYTEYLAEALGPAIIYRTNEGVPSTARNVTVIVLTPVEIQVEWFPPANPRGPLENITYVVKWSTLTSSGVYLEGQTERSAVRQIKIGKFYTYLKSMQPKHTYLIKVLAYDGSKQLYSESAAVQTKTFDTPGDLTLFQSFPNALRLIWTSPADDSVTRHSYQYAKVTSGELMWMLHDDIPLSTENNTEYEVDFTELEPNTDYVFQIKALYQSTKFSLYIWPNDRRYTFRTMTDVPDQPFPPKFHQLKSGTYEIVWAKPDDNGAPIEHYLLEYSFPSSNEWHAAFNGSDLRWVVDDDTLRPRQHYIFRVAAENDNGWSPYSDNSTVFTAPSALRNSVVTEEVGIAIAVSISFIIIVIIIVITGICICTKRRQYEKKKTREFIAVYQAPDMELATLRELPHTTVQQSNTLYGISYVPTAEDIASLPHFRRDQLNLTKFLGSGAFGEVFMGVAKDILYSNSGETKVAVKTLRKSATESEKEEFLKEALLMSNFHHEHILGLLGVCLDNDPQFLILELMEGSDLLSFLRNCRATSSTPCKLLLPDLVQICVHVARGCKYLEEMHFVHRDLAARNCLVSSVHPVEMVIKIGDFGLARDIYKNDYYRKEGEGLLPVRWMSPESLVDGVFTTLSDIWAFGVLMWEVVTLGQQPYPARTNIEVLHFVRAGGKLERPEKCPDEIYELMQKCWSFSPEDRPTFSFLLQKLEHYKEVCDNMTPDEIAQSSPTALDVKPSAMLSSTNTDFYFGLANLAFDDEVVTSDMSSDEDQELGMMFTHQKCPHQRREGGSVRLTPTSKKRRLMTLLGGAEANEKLTVDLPHQMKRTLSLDSKHSTASDDPRISYSQVHFLPEREYDEMGYLKPRKKEIPKYIELINDPDQGGMQPVNEHTGSPTASVSSSISRHSSLYAAMSKGNGPSSLSSAKFPLIQFNDSNGNPDLNRAVQNSPDKPPPYQVAKAFSSKTKNNNSSRTCKNDPCHTDKDSRPLINGRQSNSSSESGYYCVECYNSHLPQYKNGRAALNYERVDEGRIESPLPNYSVWSNNNNGHSDSPEYVNVSNHGGRMSRNQIYPENGAAFAGFEISQASLV